MLGIFQYQGILHTWIIVGQGHTALAAGASEGCLDFFSLSPNIFLFFLPLLSRRLDID